MSAASKGAAQAANQPRVAIIHDWLTGMRGGEYVLEAIIDLFPDADLFTLLYVDGKVSPKIAALPRHTSWLQKVPQAERRYRHFLPLMPQMAENFDLSEYDLVISSSHCVAKGVRKATGAVHVSYVHAPMRYVWDRFDEYFGPGRASFAVRTAARVLRGRLQKWDRAVSAPERVDQLVANSGYIAEQMRACYGREARVVHPFVDLSRFQLPRQPGRNYLMVGAFAPNKRVDLAIEAFNRLGLPLIIVGSGQDQEKLRRMAGKTILFLGSISNEEISTLYSQCRAFVFPGVEDFGITPLEAMAAGAPVIAFRAGGVIETVTEKTGIFFDEPTVDSLIQAVEKIEAGKVQIREEDCRAQAAKFTCERFQREFKEIVDGAWAGKGVSKV